MHLIETLHAPRLRASAQGARFAATARALAHRLLASLATPFRRPTLPCDARLRRDVGLEIDEDETMNRIAANIDPFAFRGLDVAQVLERMRRDCLSRPPL